MTDERVTIAALIDRLSHSAYGGGAVGGLKPAQWTALRFFSIVNRFSATASAFAQYQGTTPGAASQTIGALVRKRLLERTRDRADGRRRHLSLTDEARALLRSDPIGALARGADVLDADDQRHLAECLEKMLGVVVRDKRASRFGRCATCRFLCRDGAGHGHAAYFCRHLQEPLRDQEIDRLCINFAPQDSPI